ncbi:MAG: carboxypeptidase regulatory-like domain-containing protein [Acidobacteriota bacterium]
MLALLLAGISFPQSDNAQISGFVRDSSNAVVPGASVILQNDNTGFQRRTATNETGYYVISSVPPGYYTVAVEAVGFKRFQQVRTKLDPDIATTVNAELEVGALTEVVDVVASVAAVRSDTASLGRLVESRQIQLMQLNGRNPVFLALLKPGVRGGSLAAFSFTPTTGSFNINGSRPHDNLLVFDGAPAERTRGNLGSVGVADVDTVQEVQILTANYNAEYGRSGGGQVRIVSKSGTREFHGDFYEFFRNSALDANTWARNRTVGNPGISGQPEAFRFNQFGYALGGPVFIPKSWNENRSKLFFLWGQEWIRHRREGTTIITVPSLAMRSGDFGELLNPSNPFFGRARVINDPATATPLPGNIIPAPLRSPNGLAFLKAYPEPVPGFRQGTNNYIQSRPALVDNRKDNVSLDLNLERHQFRFRHQNYAFIQPDAFRGGTDRAPTITRRPAKTASVNYVFTVTPTLINELLVTGSNARVYSDVDTSEGLYQRSRYGINYPYLFPERKEIPDKIPTIDIANFVTVDGGPYPSKSTGPIYMVSNHLTKVWSNHTIKAGFLWEKSGQNDFDQINTQGVPGGTNNQNGRFVFTDVRTGAPNSGLAVANAAMGLFTSYAEIGVRSFTPYRSNMYEWFVQDSWKVTPRLRLELGLRHSIMQPFFSLWRNMVAFDPRFYDAGKAVAQDPRTGYVISGDQYNGLVIPGSGWPDAARGRIPIADSGEFDRLFKGLPKGYSQTHMRDFQPRVGIAYGLNPKTVVRAGFGRFFSRLGVGDSVFLGGNPPLQPMISISNGLADNPAAGRPSSFPFNVGTRDPVYGNPNSWTWNATVERELPFDTTVEISYVGKHSLSAARERNINQLLPGTVQANPGVNPDVLRPFKGFGPIRMTTNEAQSWYKGFQVGVTRRFTKGLSYGIAYTLSSTEDDASGPRDLLPNAYDGRNFWGPASYDTRHVLVVNFIYELPLFRDRSALTGKLLGGWQVTGVSQFQTGSPVTASTSDDFAGVGVGSGAQIWNISGSPAAPRGERKFSESASDSNFYFRTRNADGSAIFAAPAAGAFTTQNNRNILRDPGWQNWNLGLFKSFYLAEKQQLQFRFEGFNWPNHPNWGGVNANPRSGTFGKVTGKSSERVLQLSLRYSF